MTLDEIGVKWRSDRSSYSHGYMRFYEPFVAPFRYKEIRLLEIGIGSGTGMKSWEEYFPLAQIVGIDIDNIKISNGDGVQPSFTERVRRDFCNQGDEHDLRRIAERYSGFEIVIDDGSHHTAHQIVSIKTLLPFVSPNGIYIIEDVFELDASRWVGEMCGRFVLYERDAEIAKLVDSIHLYRGAAVFRRNDVYGLEQAKA